MYVREKRVRHTAAGMLAGTLAGTLARTKRSVEHMHARARAQTLFVRPIRALDAGMECNVIGDRAI